MTEADKGHVTELLDAAADGDEAAVNDLWSTVHDELRLMAASLLSNEKPGATLQPTMVVSEVYLRLLPSDGSPPSWENRRHFFGSVARSMNQFLIDHARQRSRRKHGGDRKRMSFEISAGELASTKTFNSDRLAEAGEAFKRLQEQFPRQAVVAFLRWMQGLTLEETSAALEVPASTINSEWKLAQAWLRRDLNRE